MFPQLFQVFSRFHECFYLNKNTEIILFKHCGGEKERNIIRLFILSKCKFALFTPVTSISLRLFANSGNICVSFEDL